VRLVWGIVVRVVAETDGAQRLVVRLDDGSEPTDTVSYPALTGRLAEGDRVLCNTTAIDRGLGTGGEHIIVAREGEGVALDDPVAGHIVKLRYTPMQRDVTVVEEVASGHHADLVDARSLGGMPVVCCGLHSQIALVAAAIKERRPDVRIAYVMTDEAALPMGVSRLVPRLVDAGLLDATITCGQSFGGQYEAVNRYSGLLAARFVAHADVAVISIGPGIVGTATALGHGGVAQGEAINAAAALDGTPVAVLRLSFADERPRHVPVSHQTLSALLDVALARAIVAVPTLPAELQARLASVLELAGVCSRHDCRVVAAAALPDLRGVEVTTMGRSALDDPAFFSAASAAGSLASDLLDANRGQ
jgi:hypothetical protein